MSAVAETLPKTGRFVNCLTIDDEADICDIVAETLKYRGVRVQTVQTIARGVELTRDETFDVVFLDVNLPYGGARAYFSLLEKESIPTPTVVLITGDVQRGLKHLHPNVVEVLAKPFSPKQLLDSLERARPKSPST